MGAGDAVYGIEQLVLSRQEETLQTNGVEAAAFFTEKIETAAAEAAEATATAEAAAAQATTEATAAAAGQPASNVHGTWTQYSDENGNAYWYDSASGTSSWIAPISLQSGIPLASSTLLPSKVFGAHQSTRYASRQQASKHVALKALDLLEPRNKPENALVVD